MTGKALKSVALRVERNLLLRSETLVHSKASSTKIELKWTYSYVDQLEDFVKTINSRTHRVTKLSPDKVTKNDIPHLVLSIHQPTI